MAEKVDIGCGSLICICGAPICFPKDLKFEGETVIGSDGQKVVLAFCRNSHCINTDQFLKKCFRDCVGKDDIVMFCPECKHILPQKTDAGYEWKNESMCDGEIKCQNCEEAGRDVTLIIDDLRAMFIPVSFGAGLADGHY